MAGGQEPVQVVIERMVRDARHRRATGTAEGARGERDPGVPGQNLGVLIKGFVEVPQAVEQDGLGVLRFEVKVLPAGGNQGRSFFPWLRAVRSSGVMKITWSGSGAGHAGSIRLACRRTGVVVWRR